MKLKSELRQNFTINASVLEDVAQTLNPQDGDQIIEIGPGKGVLTQKIISRIKRLKDAKLLSYEVDEELRDDLEDLKHKNSTYFDYRIQNFIEAKPKQSFNKCTGNIPYHISEPLFFKFIEWDFDEIVMITGIKFARKVCGEFEGKIATISRYLFESHIEKEYDKNIFYPKSKVDSALLVMRKKVNFDSETDKKIAEVMKNTDKKHQWLNKFLGFEQSQTGQIYHMDLELLVNEIKTH